MKVYKKYYSLLSTIVLLFLVILCLLILIVLPIIQPIEDRIDIMGYTLLLIIFLPCISFLLYRVFSKTFVLITVSEKGIERKTILQSNHCDWNEISIVEKVSLPDYVSGYGSGYRFEGSSNSFEVFRCKELDLLLNTSLEIWSKELYKKFIEIKDNK